MNATQWENSPQRPPNPIDPQERLIGSLVCAIFLIFVTMIIVLKFMHGLSPGWGWAIVGGCVVGAYRVWLL